MLNITIFTSSSVASNRLQVSSSETKNCYGEAIDRVNNQRGRFGDKSIRTVHAAIEKKHTYST